MTLTNVALYEALKPTIGEEAARMIAEVVPPTRDLATKRDTDALGSKIEGLRAATKRDTDALSAQLAQHRAEIDGRIHAETTRTIKWLIGVFVPVWLATWGWMFAFGQAR